MGWWLALVAAHARCETDRAAELPALVASIEQAFEAVDDAAFEEARGALEAAIGCVRSPLPVSTIVAWHRARALGAFFDREPVASARSWAAVRVLDPSYRLPESWAPPGSPLQQAWADAPMGAARHLLERQPAGGWLVDGQPIAAVPAERAFVLQGVDAGAQLVHTGYHHSIAEVPVVDFLALDPTLGDMRRRRARMAGSTIGAVLGVGAAVALGFAAAERSALSDRATPPDALRSHARRANASSSAAAGLAIGAVAVVSGAWLIRW